VPEARGRLPTHRLLYALAWAVAGAVYLWRVITRELRHDIFEHAASVRELGTNPDGPMHPLFLIEAPHSLFSPYSYVLGLIHGATGADPVSVLAAAGILNLVLLAFGLHSFVRVFTRSAWAPTLAVIFSLVLWGLLPPAWSGMLHLQSIGYGLPYPSALVLGTVLLCLAQLHTYLFHGGWPRLVLISAVTAFGILSHPYTAALLAIGAAAFMIKAFGTAPGHRLVRVVAAGVTGAAMTLLWPFVPIADLILGQGEAWGDTHRQVYESLVPWTFLAWIGVPALVIRARHDLRDPLVLIFAITALAYAAGFVLGQYNVGRLLPILVLALHVSLAVVIADWWERRGAAREGRGAVWMVRVGSAALVMLMGLSTLRVAVATHDSYATIASIARRVPQYEVVMADLETSRRVPVWGGKVVGWDGALPFITDVDDRKLDVERFFAEGTTQAERTEILNRWGAGWVVIDSTRISIDQATQARIERLGTVVQTDAGGSVILVRLDGS
jgi:hypothetical protein